ncbi:MAG: hypothetical protein ACE5FA_10535 [Dehalococcoidia bacterium]
MTETEIPTEANPTDDWDTQFAGLQTRFPKVKDTILLAFHVLQQDPDIALDDLKARAKLHGLRVTAATVSAARRLLDRNPATDGAVATAQRKEAKAKPRNTRQRRATQAPVDVEALVRRTVAKIEDQAGAEAERLRAAMRKAIAVLEGAVG